MKHLIALTAQPFAADLPSGVPATKAWDYFLVGSEGQGWMAIATRNLRSNSDRHYLDFGILEPEVHRTSGRYKSPQTVPK